MKKICKPLLTLMLAFILMMNSLFLTPVHAGTFVRSTKLSEEERYNPEYYRPFGERRIDTSLRGADIALDAFEDDIVNGITSYSDKIDIAKYQLSSGDLRTYYYQILNSHPELFYVEFSFSYMSDMNGIAFVCPVYSMSQQEAEQIQTKLDLAAAEATALVTDDMEDYEKALIVHDWLSVYCEYDYENLQKGDVPEISHTAIGALINKTAVCDGYSKAFQYIMQSKLGIPCYLTSSSEMDHAWNIILINGNYYHVDITWDDPVSDITGRVCHDNFLRSDEGIKQTGHTGWDSSLKASDTSLDNALWQNSSGSIIPYGGNWYYVDETINEEYNFNLLKTDNILSGTTTKLYSIAPWQMNSEGYFYTIAYSFPQIYRNKLIFNGPKQIYVMPFATETVTTLFAPEQVTDAAANIYGFKLIGNTLYYSLQSPQTDASQTSSLQSSPIPGKTLNGEVTLTGDLRYGSVLTAKLTAAEDIEDNLVYAWYRDGKKIADAAEQTYTLAKQDIGTIISVHIFHDDYINELTAETTAIQKALSTRPTGTLSLKGYYNETLSSIDLPAGYTWQNPDTVITATGLVFYPVVYCPDDSCYEAITDLEASVQVSCKTHLWDSGIITKQPTAKEPGTKTFTCTICQTTRTEEIEPPVPSSEALDSQVPDSQIPSSEALDSQIPDSQVPSSEALDSQVPDSQVPSSEALDSQIPDSQIPSSEALDSQVPDSQISSSEALDSQIPDSQVPSSEALDSQIPDSQVPSSETPSVPQPPASEISSEEPPASEISSEEPPAQQPSIPKKGDILQSGKISYKVTKSGAKNGTVAFAKTTSTSKTITIPSTVTINGIKYKVTSIAAGAFKNKTKLTKVVIGSNVATIGKEAFLGCRNLKTISIKSTKLKKVERNAIKNINKNAKIQCPGKKTKSYKKLFTSKTGYKKTMSVK